MIDYQMCVNLLFLAFVVFIVLCYHHVHECESKKRRRICEKAQTHTISVSQPWFDHIQERTKIYEGRCNWKKAATYRVGDTLLIREVTLDTDSSFELSARITEIHQFVNFKHALMTLPLEQVLPGIKSESEGIEVYKQFVSDRTQEVYGVLMIKFELDSDDDKNTQKQK